MFVYPCIDLLTVMRWRTIASIKKQAIIGYRIAGFGTVAYAQHEANVTVSTNMSTETIYSSSKNNYVPFVFTSIHLCPRLVNRFNFL